MVGGVDVTSGGEVPGAHNVVFVTLQADGTYSLVHTLNEPTLDASGQGETDVFAVVVTDEDGDTAEASLTVLINDRAGDLLQSLYSDVSGADLVAKLKNSGGLQTD